MQVQGRAFRNTGYFIYCDPSIEAPKDIHGSHAGLRRSVKPNQEEKATGNLRLLLQPRP